MGLQRLMWPIPPSSLHPASQSPTRQMLGMGGSRPLASPHRSNQHPPPLPFVAFSSFFVARRPPRGVLLPWFRVPVSLACPVTSGGILPGEERLRVFFVRQSCWSFCPGFHARHSSSATPLHKHWICQTATVTTTQPLQYPFHPRTDILVQPPSFVITTGK